MQPGIIQLDWPSATVASYNIRKLEQGGRVWHQKSFIRRVRSVALILHFLSALWRCGKELRLGQLYVFPDWVPRPVQRMQLQHSDSIV